MTLNFMQQFEDGTPTEFVEKITKGVHSKVGFTKGKISEAFRDSDLPYVTDNYSHMMFEDTINECWKILGRPKIHTIRSGDRWNAGNDIHFKIWTGKPYVDKTFNFLPVIPCVSVQEIEIKWGRVKPIVKIDGVILEDMDAIQKLAVNDGFSGWGGFCSWFNKDFKGQIIHWTDLKY